MGIPTRIQRLLWSRSGGYCQNPSCNRDVFTFFEDGAITSIEELAHIIAESTGGPRGLADLLEDERNEFENLLVLCPSCHTLIDKSPEQFPVAILQDWKRRHEERISQLFIATEASSRAELRSLLWPLMQENEQVFYTYGPYAMPEPGVSSIELAVQWQRHSIGTIIPNNRHIAALLRRNLHLLNNGEAITASKFFLHQEAFEYNHLSGDKNAAAPLYPIDMGSILGDAN